MRYNNFAIEQNKKWLVETAMKNSTPKRLAGHLFEASEQITQLQEDLKAQIADAHEVRRGVWLPILESEITGWNPELAGRDPVGDIYAQSARTKLYIVAMMSGFYLIFARTAVQGWAAMNR